MKHFFPHGISSWLLLVFSLLLQQHHAFNLTILHVNDHHSHLEGDEFNIDLANLPFNLSNTTGLDEGVSVPYGGFARLKTLMDLYDTAVDNDDDENDANNSTRTTTTTTNVLKLHAGDALVGTPIYSIFQVQADAALMNQLCFDAFCLGNHEFDDGDTNLANFITALRSNKNQTTTKKCSTAVLGANVVPGDASPLRALQESGDLTKSLTVQFGTGTNTTTMVGIVGIDIRNKTLGSSRPDIGTTLLDERETAQIEVQTMVDAGVDIIILLTHIGYDLDLAWMVDIPHVDVIVGGDSHSLLGDTSQLGTLFTAIAPYPGVVTTSVNGSNRTVCVVQAWEFAHGLGQLDVQFNDEGEVVTCRGYPVFPIGPPVLDNATEAAAVTAYLVGLGTSFVPVEEDNATLTVLQEFTGQLSDLLAQTIATVPKDICFERIPGQGRSTICPVNASATQGGGVCNLVAQAFLSQTLEADVAIQNAGGCRTDIAAGNFTYEDAYNLLPFSNTLVLLEMNGSDVKLVLEQALENSFASASTGSYPYAAGLRYDVNANGALGNRVSNLEYNIRLAGEWAPIDLSAIYSVVANDFIAAGLDGYTRFSTAENVVDTQTAYAQVFIDYAIDQGTLLDPSLDTYSTKSFVPLQMDVDTPAAAPVDAGPSSASFASCWRVIIVLVWTTIILACHTIT